MIRDEFKVHSMAAGKRRRKVTVESPEPGVTSVMVDPNVWSTAKRLADGDLHRIRVVGPTEVVVANGRVR